MADPVARLNAALQGRYLIEREIGEGGMATVYLAQDLKHERPVALKVLKPELAAVVGAERFVAEIKTTANLQHPHILALHDSGEADSFLFYVMPYVEGETLRDRIDREKQLPVPEAVRIAAAVAQALDHAHRQGVVHRDIKPANVLLQDGQPVVADFGIALAVGSAGGSRLTETGLSLGTPFYMSPEQATGDQPMGPSSDIYAVACVLYEMLVGEPPYLGNTAQAVLGKIIAGDPVSPTVVRQSIPANVDAAIRRALEKIPADRFGTAQEFADALADPGFRHGVDARDSAAATPGRWRAVAVGFAAMTLALGWLAGWALLRPPLSRSSVRVSVVLPQERGGFSGSIALSPDGSVMVYETADDQTQRLWIRRLDELQGRALPGSDFGVRPSISPDGREVAYTSFAATPERLEVVPLQGGVARTVSDEVACCVHWARDGFIYFSDVDRGISRVAAGGGPREVVTRSGVDGARHTYPFVVDDVGVQFTQATVSGPEVQAIAFGSDEIVTLLSGGVRPHVTSSGHLVFASPAGELLAAPFDSDALEMTGPPVPILGGVDYTPGALFAPFALSTNGTLLYGTGSVNRQYQVAWVDRSGSATVIDPEWTMDPGGNNRGLALSPDGSRLAVSILGDLAEDIWVKTLPTGPLSRLTADSAWDVRPRWTPDGERVTFVSNRVDNNADLYAQPADGTGAPELLLDAEASIWEGIVSADGWLIGRTGGTVGTPGARDIVVLAPGADGPPEPLLQSSFDEKAIALSPDGRWLAYESDETGRNEIYVRPFPDADAGKWQVSSTGGVMPLWAHSGDELFYVDTRQRMVTAQVSLTPEFVIKDRTILFEIGPEFLFSQQEQYTLYDIAPDDQRFVMFRGADETTRELILVQDWFEELNERVGN